MNHTFDQKTKYQKFSHYLLPITINPLKYGKVIERLDNKYIIQLNTSNILVIKTVNNDNFIRFFRKGNLILEFVDSKVTEIMFTRTIQDQKFTFENNKLITTEILGLLKTIKIYDNVTLLNYSEAEALNITPFKYNMKNIINKKAELFILFELFLVFSIFIICFVIFPEVDSVNTSLAVFSKGNIIKLRRTRSRNI
jgi:hypothetical protein